jgi:hypothetical protein
LSELCSYTLNLFFLLIMKPSEQAMTVNCCPKVDLYNGYWTSLHFTVSSRLQTTTGIAHKYPRID